ncbi:thioesterase II family protein [Aquimarina rhabdastrellae]
MKPKIIAFPFAGGNKYSFPYLKEKFLNEKISFSVLEYPGRGRRIRESLLKDIIDVANDAYEQLIKEIPDRDYIIYGHSMGAIIGYLVCIKLQESNQKMPIKLIVSGREAPTALDTKERLFDLESSDIFWKKIHELGGLSVELLSDHKLKTFFEPVLRADFQCIENYQYQSKPKITIPVHVFYGTDEKMTKEELDGWKDITISPEITFESIKGDHFFINNNSVFAETILQYF